MEPTPTTVTLCVRLISFRGFNKGRSSKFCEGSRVWQTPEEGCGTYRPKRCGNNTKDEHNNPKTLRFLCLVAYLKLRCLFSAKTIILEEQQWCYLTYCWEDKEVHTFPKGICPKVNADESGSHHSNNRCAIIHLTVALRIDLVTVIVPWTCSDFRVVL